MGCYAELFDRQDGFYLWTLFILNKLKIAHLNKSLFYYRIYGKNLSKNSLKILKERKKIIVHFIKKDKSKIKDLLSLEKKLNMKLNFFRNLKNKLKKKRGCYLHNWAWICGFRAI